MVALNRYASLMLEHSIRYPQDSIYNNAFIFKLKGRFDVERFEQSVHAVIAADAHLSTYADAAVRMAIVDDVDEVYAAVLEPLRVAEKQFFRVIYTVVDTDEHVVAIVCHHALLDGVTTHYFFQRLSDYYNNAHLVSCQYESIAKNDADAALHWQKRLDGLEQHHPYAQKKLLPQSHSRRIPLDVDKRLLNDIRLFLSEHHCSLFQLLMSTLTLAVSVYTGENDVSNGYSVSTNPYKNTQPLGCYVNTLPLRVNVDMQACFVDLLEHVRGVRKQDRPYQHYPYENMLRQYRLDSQSSDAQLFYAVLNEMVYSGYHLSFNGLTCVQLPVFDQIAKYPFVLLYQLTDQGLRVEYEYANALVSHDEAQDFVMTFLLLLEQVVNNPHQCIKDYHLVHEIAALQRQQDNATEQPELVANDDLFALIRQSCFEQANNTALRYDSISISYTELFERAMKVANMIADQGLVNQAVMIRLPRSPEYVYAVLGVLASGNTFVPVSVDQPLSRCQYIAENSQCVLVLTQRDIALDYPIHVNATAYLDDMDQWCAADAMTVPASRYSSVMYTSGSTGKPKGVLCTQLGLINRLLWMKHYLQVTPSDTILFKTPCGFDVSLWEVLLPLVSGASMVVMPEYAHASVAMLAEVIEKERVSCVHFVPTMMANYLLENAVSTLRHVKHIVFSGEALPLSILNQLSYLPNTQLDNFYGPTEASIDVTYWRYCDGADRVYIGQPISNVKVRVLDALGREVPYGVAGFLHVSGVCLADGYIANELATQKAFIDYVDQGRELRLYNTGDLVKLHFDGMIEYLGRADTQIKVRGVRIELKEIEANLDDYASVSASVVVVKNDRLIAFVVGDISDDPASILRPFLLQRLPYTMVPDSFVVVDALPITRNGKVDRRALLNRLPRLNENYTMRYQNSDVNARAIWQHVLGVADINDDDSFFMLGGDSILAVDLTRLVYESLGKAISVADVFHYSTLKAFSEYLATVAHVAHHDAYRYRDMIVYPLLPNQRGVFQLSLQDASAPAFNLCMRYDIDAVMNHNAFLHAIAKLVENTTTLNLAIYELDMDVVAVVKKHGQTNVFFVDASQYDDPSGWVTEQCRVHSREPMYLSDEYLYQIYLYKLSQQKSVLYIKAHHIVFDGESLQSFVVKLLAAYTDYCRSGRMVIDNDLPLYYCAMQTRHSAKACVQTQEKLHQYQQALTTGKIPSVVSSDHSDAYLGDVISLDLGESLVARLKNYCHRSHTSLSQLLFSVYSLALHDWHQSSHLTLGVVMSSRQAEEKDVLAMLTNTLLFSSAVVDAESIDSFLQRQIQTLIGLYDYREFSCEQLDSSAFDAAFVFGLDQSQQIVADEVSATCVPIYSGYAKFPLALYCHATEVMPTLYFEFQKHYYSLAAIQTLSDRMLMYLQSIVAEQRITLAPVTLSPTQHDHIVTPDAVQTHADDFIRALVKEAWSRVLDVADIADVNDFFALGGSSIKAVTLTHQLQKVLSCSLSLQALFMHSRFDAYCDYIASVKQGHSLTDFNDAVALLPNIMSLSNASLKRPIFFMHPLGGTVYRYQLLADCLSDIVSSFGLYDTSVNSGRLEHQSVSAMAYAYYQQLIKLQPDGAYCLIGYSSGSLLALEVATLLTQAGKKVAFLGFIDGWLRMPEAFYDQQWFTKSMLRQSKQINRRFIPGLYEADREKWLEILWRRMSMILNYQAPVWHGDVYLFKASDLRGEYIPKNDAYNHWRQVVEGQVVVYEVPGDHETVLAYEHVAALETAVRQALELAGVVETDNSLAKLCKPATISAQ